MISEDLIVSADYRPFKRIFGVVLDVTVEQFYMDRNIYYI